MSKIYCVNNEWVEKKDVLSINNRAFKYGDGLFESIRVFHGVAFNLSAHLDRLIAGLNVLKISIPDFFNLTFLEQNIATLLNKNNLSSGRIRLTVYRNGKGFYTSEGDELGWVMEVNPVTNELFELNESGLNVDVYEDVKKHSDLISAYKTCNGLLYVMAGSHAKENGLDECFILNHKNNVIESTSANVFIVKNNQLFTPSIEDGCIGGTMRMCIINLALDLGIKVFECSLHPGVIADADEVFLTNASSGIRWVSKFKTARYFHKMSSRLTEALNEKVFSLEKDSQEN